MKKTILIDDEDAVVELPDNYALLFCYFNDEKAFKDYMNRFSGNVVIVIGPDEGQNRTTDPLPFDIKFEELRWILRNERKLDNRKDVATVYTRL